MLLGLVFMAGDCAPPSGRQQGFFPGLRGVTIPEFPPADGLLLWLEGGPSDDSDATAYLRRADSGPAAPGQAVVAWRDVRWRPTQVAPFVYPTAVHFGFFEGSQRFEGQAVDVPLIGADRVERTVRALRCGTPDDADTGVRCSYQVWWIVPVDLNGLRYTILAVVRRISGRGSNYFIMSDAMGRCSSLTGIDCPANSALHLGWEGERTARLGHYYNDSSLEEVPAFRRNNYPISFFVGRAGAIGKQVALLEPNFNVFNTVSDTRPLANSGTLFVGGTPWGSRTGVPDWRFVGDVLAVLVYMDELNPENLLMAEAYLRGKYGPE